MIKRKEIGQLPLVEPVYEPEADTWEIQARIYGDSLVLDAWCEGEYRFRHAIDGINYCTKRGNEDWGHQTIIYAMNPNQYFYMDPETYRMTEDEEKLVKDFIKARMPEIEKYIWKEDPLEYIRRMEDNLKEQSKTRAWNNRMDRTEQRVSQIDVLPADMYDWAREELFTRRYLFYDSKQRKSGKCAYCQAKVKLDGAQRYNGKIICPSCGKKVVCKTVGKKPVMSEKKNVVYLQPITGGIIEQHLELRKISSSEGERFTASYICIVTRKNGKKPKIDWALWEDGLKVGWSDERPQTESCWDGSGWLYAGNLPEALKNTPYKYVPLREWSEARPGIIPVHALLECWEQSPFLEYFVKMGLYKLTTEYIRQAEYGRYWKGRRPEQILGLTRENVRRLARRDGGMISLEWMKYGQVNQVMIRDEILDWAEENRIKPNYMTQILQEVSGLTKMVHYIQKQPDQSTAIQRWNDYLRMAATLGYNLHDDIALYPKDLKAAHDRALTEIEASRKKQDDEKYAALDRRILERLPDVKRLYWHNDKYEIIPAGKCSELQEEGRILHHCVGQGTTYMERMASGRSWICFLRKRSELEKPYYTLEIEMDSDRILQYYSEYDRKPDKEIIDGVLKEYKNALIRRPRRIRAIAS